MAGILVLWNLKLIMHHRSADFRSNNCSVDVPSKVNIGRKTNLIFFQAEFKFSRKVIVRLLALPVLFYCNAWVLAHTASFQNKFLQYYMLYSVPDKAFRNEMVNSIFELHGTDLKDYCFKQQTCVPIIFVSKFSRERNVRTSKSKVSQVEKQNSAIFPGCAIS